MVGGEEKEEGGVVGGRGECIMRLILAPFFFLPFSISPQILIYSGLLLVGLLLSVDSVLSPLWASLTHHLPSTANLVGEENTSAVTDNQNLLLFSPSLPLLFFLSFLSPFLSLFSPSSLPSPLPFPFPQGPLCGHQYRTGHGSQWSQGTAPSHSSLIPSHSSLTSSHPHIHHPHTGWDLHHPHGTSWAVPPYAAPTGGMQV